MTQPQSYLAQSGLQGWAVQWFERLSSSTLVQTEDYVFGVRPNRMEVVVRVYDIGTFSAKSKTENNHIQNHYQACIDAVEGA